MPNFVSINNIADMKELFAIIIEDYRKEGFTRRDYFIYGILAPMAFTAACILASAFN